MGHARKALRPLAGISPDSLPPVHSVGEVSSSFDAAGEWQRRPKLKKGSPAWRYLTEARGLPVAVVERAISFDLLREGLKGTVLMAHRGASSARGMDGAVVAWEMRGRR